MPLPPLPWRAPDPGRIWLAGGMPAAPGSLAAQRNAALFLPDAAPATPLLGEAREVTVLPALTASVPALPDLLADLRAAAPEAVLRLELWLDHPRAAPLDPALRRALAAAQPLFVHAVIAQAEAWNPGAEHILRALADAGVPTAAEIVLRRGAICTPEAVRALCLPLQRAGTRPYFLVDGAWLGPEQRVPRPEALEIVRALRGWISGLAVPQLVEEACDGGRVPVIPPYVRQWDAGGVEVVNYEGRRLRYTNPPDERG